MNKENFEMKCRRLLDKRYVSFRACAKVNLFLDITGRREDGYHYIRSLFVPVSLFDVLKVRASESKGIEVSCDEEWFEVQNNSLVKAYRIFAEESGFSTGLKVELKKNIPAGSGLGGASSDAAALLKILNNLMYIRTKRRLNRKQLLKVGSKIGADVPFFLDGRPSLVEGIGEKISKVNLKDEIYMIIIWPGLPFYTKEMYREYDRLNRLTKSVKGDKHLPPFLGYKYITGSVYNVFETVLRGSNLKMIMRLKKALISNGAESAALSGSGSAVFGLYKSATDARIAFKRLAGDFREFKLFSVRVLRGGF